MYQYFLHKVVATLVVVALLLTGFVSFVESAALAAPVAQQVRAREVTGTIPGGQFAQIWLAVQPENPGDQVTLIAEWDRNNPTGQGLNFFILDDQGVRRVGEDSLSTIALGAGSANFAQGSSGSDNTTGASFNASGTGTYTVVVSNESSQDANFTLRATNAFILDESGQVTDPSAPAATTEGDGDTETAADDATTETTTDDATTETAPAETAADTTTAVTTTVATTETAPVATTAVVTATATPTPVVTTTTVAGTARAAELSGSLPEQNEQHFLALEPEGRDSQVTLRLNIQPEDNAELTRSLNFWVLDEDGFKRYLGGTDPSDVAIAAGNRVFRGVEHERVASFRVVGTGTYTVIVYNSATIPGTYTLRIEGGLLVDDAGQTNEAATAGTTLSATGTLTTSTTTTATTTTTAGTTTTTTPARAGEPGGTYTVQSGDTLALIARDIYGNLALYTQLCAFNNIANCNVIEVGDVLQLPTQAQISAGTTAPAAATPAATTATTAVATPPAVSATESVTETAPATLTATETSTATTTTGTTTATTADESSSVSGSTIYATLVDNGNFTTLVKALDQSGLDSVLNGANEFTLFAPTDAAFVALRNRFSLTEAQLLGLPELTDTLRYHVLSGAALSTGLSDGMAATTVQGKDVRFEVDGDAVKINGANIIAADVETANGVIHVIDAVIIPPAE